MSIPIILSLDKESKTADLMSTTSAITSKMDSRVPVRGGNRFLGVSMPMNRPEGSPILQPTGAVFPTSSASQTDANGSDSTGYNPCTVAPERAPRQLGVHISVFQSLLRNHPGLTTEQLCTKVVKPATAALQCAYVELLLDQTFAESLEQDMQEPSLESAAAAAALSSQVSSVDYKSSKSFKESENTSSSGLAIKFSSSKGSMLSYTTPTASSDRSQSNFTLVAPATCFVSHAWKTPFKDVVDCLTQYENTHHNTYYWFDVLTHNQYQNISSQHTEWWSNVFKKAIQNMGDVIFIMSPWNKPIALTRLWCLFELYSSSREVNGKTLHNAGSVSEKGSTFITSPTGSSGNGQEGRLVAIGERSSQLATSNPPSTTNSFNSGLMTSIPNIHFSIPQSQHDAFRLAMGKALHRTIQGILSTVDLNKADVSNGREKIQILEVIKNEIKGGIVALNARLREDVKTHLMNTFIALALQYSDDSNLFAASSSYIAEGAAENAAMMLEHCVKVREKTLGSQHPSTAIAFNALAQVYDSMGDQSEKAIFYFEKDLTYKLGSVPSGSFHPSIPALYNTLGRICLKQQKNYERAILYFEKCLTAYGSTLEDNLLHVAATYASMAEAFRQKGDYENALMFFKKSLEKKIILFGEESRHPSVAETYFALGQDIYGNRENPSCNIENAIECLEKCLSIRLSALGPQNIETLQAYHALGRMCSAAGGVCMEWGEESNGAGGITDGYLVRCFVHRLRVKDADNADNSQVDHSTLAPLQNREEQFSSTLYLARALSVYDAYLAVLSTSPESKKNIELARAYREKGLIHRCKGEFSQASQCFEKTLAHFSSLLGEKNSDTASVYYDMGLSNQLAGSRDIAKGMFGKAASIFNALLGPEHPKTKDARKRYVEMHKQ